ncbi:MAG: PIN domain-containing protein [Balneolaceae bacterium]
MISVLIDAGPIIALFDKDDQHYERVLNYMREFHGRLITTWPVLTEVCYMLDFNLQTRLDFLDWVSDGGIEIYNLEQWQIKQIRNLMEKYADLPADLADATLIEAAVSLKLESVITIDSDFQVYRLKNGKALQNLLQ